MKFMAKDTSSDHYSIGEMLMSGTTSMIMTCRTVAYTIRAKIASAVSYAP